MARKDYYRENEENIYTGYEYVTETNKTYDLLVNQTKKGYLFPLEKGVNFFLKIKTPYGKIDSSGLINKLKEISEILLIFELDLKRNIDKFIFYDKKN